VKKEFRFDELSNKVCAELGCIKRLKKRLVDGNASKFARNITHCYNHQPKHTISGHSARGRS
jgi:hypothetical protein